MNYSEFEQTVQMYGKDILRFCRMKTGNIEEGDELYQDTMLKLLEKIEGLDSQQNIKGYAISVSILLWKNKKRKFARRFRALPMESLEELQEQGVGINEEGRSLEEDVLHKKEIEMVQNLIRKLPEKYSMPLYMFYSANMQINEIAQVLKIPEGTVKSRMRKGKQILKKELEA